MAINWYPGHMQKTKRQIKENIDLIDIVYEPPGIWVSGPGQTAVFH